MCFTITKLSDYLCGVEQSLQWDTTSGSAITDNPSRRTAAWRRCVHDKLATELSRQFSTTSAAFSVLHLHYTPTLWLTPFEFRRDFRHQKTGVPVISCDFVGVILRLAVSVEHRLVTDGRTDTRRQLIPAIAIVARVNIISCSSLSTFPG